jgi:hypothetical protein
LKKNNKAYFVIALSDVEFDVVFALLALGDLSVQVLADGDELSLVETVHIGQRWNLRVDVFFLRLGLALGFDSQVLGGHLHDQQLELLLLVRGEAEALLLLGILTRLLSLALSLLLLALLLLLFGQ